MASRLLAVSRQPIRIFSVQNICITSSRSVAQHDGAPYYSVPKTSEYRYGSNVIKTSMAESGEARLTDNGLFIPEGDWATGNAKLQKRWNIYLAVAVLGWIAVTYWAMTNFNLRPTYIFPIAVCKERDGKPSTLHYDTDCTRYYQQFDEVLPEGEDEDEEEED